jgi:exodeoxyribonuclease VII small subunit
MSTKEEKKERKFEEMITELESIVKELENGNVDLDVAIDKYTEAMKLAKLCGDRLNDATERVNKILADNGNLEDFIVEE